jgi:hypothetical protein
VKLDFPNESPDNRDVRRNAHVAVLQGVCRHTSALQCLGYIETVRISFIV